jgi:hypothetical protein
MVECQKLLILLLVSVAARALREQRFIMIKKKNRKNYFLE